MRAAIVVIVVSAIVGIAATGQSDDKLLPLASKPERVVVNSQKSLAEAIGDGFRGQDGWLEPWGYPNGLLPHEFLGLSYVSGPGDAGLGPMGAWRKPVVMKDKATGIEFSVNCYRLRERQEPAVGSPGQPFVPLAEPDYQYKPTAFHKLRAAAGAAAGRQVFAFRDGDMLFKVEAAGGKEEVRQESAIAVAEAIWKFRHPE